MDATAVIGKTLEYNADFVQKALDGLSEADLMKRPSDHSNPIGWLVWHQSRGEDMVLSSVTGEEQVWSDGQLAKKFGTDSDLKNTGTGQTPDQTGNFKAAKKDLLDYSAAVRKKTSACLEKLSPADLEREVPFFAGGTIKVGDFLAGLTMDNSQHSGQICYLRGHYKGFGWFPM